MAFAFEKLLVYQKAVAFADAVCTLTKGFPRGYFFLADQLNRAAPFTPKRRRRAANANPAWAPKPPRRRVSCPQPGVTVQPMR